MAHLDPRFQHPEPADRGLLRVVCTWNTLAISALALMVVAPMLVISALLMLEAVLPSSRHNVEAFHGERPGAYARTTFTSLDSTKTLMLFATEALSKGRFARNLTSTV